MSITLPASGTTHHRRYAPTDHAYIVVAVWRERRGEWVWRVTHYGVNMYGIRRYQFRAFGEGRTLREAWRGVRNHYRIYSGGRDIVRDKEVGR